MRFKIVLGFYGGVGTILLGCAAPVSDQKAIVFQVSSEPVSVDPAGVEDGAGLRLEANLMDGWVGIDREGKLEKRLAANWQSIEGGRVFRFQLRPGVKWSDGVPIRAQDFELGLKRALKPSTGSKLASLFEALENVRAVTESEVEYRLKWPDLKFPELLALSQAHPIRQDVLDQNGGKWPLTAPTTGAYRVAKTRLDESTWLEPNVNYWNHEVMRDRPAVIFKVVADETTAVRLFDSKQVDIVTRVPSLEISRYREQRVLVVEPFLATYFIGFDVNKSPFQKKEVRRQVSASIRRQELVDALGTGEVASLRWIPEALEGGRPATLQLPLLESSLQAIHKAKGDLPVVVLGYDSSSRNTLILEKVQSDLKKNRVITAIQALMVP
jgi:ABC-type transport system substrate-binding protein